MCDSRNMCELLKLLISDMISDSDFGEEQPTSKERWLHGHRRAERSYSTFKVRRGGGEEIPLVQGEVK